MQSITINDIAIRSDIKESDFDSIVSLHADLYSKEYGYGINFEKHVNEGLKLFLDNYNPEKERIWIAEHIGKFIGIVLLQDRGNDIAQLRYFLIHPDYRGIGLGKRLLELFFDLYKEKNYKNCYLWTTHELSDAAILYKKFGFTLTEEVDSEAFGKKLKEQRYDLIS